MDTVKTGEKDCEEETLQTAFKKLRVDAERYLINIALFIMCYMEYNVKTQKHHVSSFFRLQIPVIFV